MEHNGNKEPAGPARSPSPRCHAPAALHFSFLLLTGACLLLVGLVIFRDFVLDDKTLLYKDMGSDSVNDTYPYFVHLSDYIRSEGFPSWSFYIGMGQNLAYRAGDLFWQPVVWLPRGCIAQALIFQHLLKILAAGLLFFRFLQLRGLDYCAALMGSLLLSFSAYMCMGSCWNINADEVVCFSFVLFAVEQAICAGRWIYVACAVVLVGLVTVFHLYLAAVLLCLYVPARLIEIYGWKPVALSRFSARLAAVAVLGVGLAAFVWLQNANAVLNSPRGSGSIANSWATPRFLQFEPPLHYTTVALRAFSNDLIGTGDDFRGWANYFEAPTNYCGLFCLLIFPQVFAGANRRRRMLYSFFISLILLPVMIPWFRHLFWLFHGGYYRSVSLFSIFAIITLSMKAFLNYTNFGRLNLPILVGTLFVLLTVLFLPMTEMQALINPTLKRTVAILLALYAIILVAGQMLKRQRQFGWAIVVLTALELIYLDRKTVNRPTVTKQELKEQVGYNDETVGAVQEITARDKSFFRITKTWPSGPAIYPSFNDAMIFGYFGTSSYSSFNNLNYIQFLVALDVISTTTLVTDAQWCPGLVGRPLLSTFACEKYMLSRGPLPLQAADLYEFIKRYENSYLFRNKLFLPLGLTFTDYISEDVFQQLSSAEKSEALFHVVVLSSASAVNKSALGQLTLDELHRRLHDSPLPDILAQRRTTALNLLSFGQTHIAGTLRLAKKSIFVLQMPFDRGWHARMDNQAAPLLKVDAGLLGVLLDGGEHSVELHYRPPLLYLGGAISIMSVAILVVSLWRWPRLQLPRREI